VSPFDALAVISHLNTEGSGLLPLPPPQNHLYLDTTNDGFVSPRDALVVIGHLNEQEEGEGEGGVTPEQVTETVASNAVVGTPAPVSFLGATSNLSSMNREPLAASLFDGEPFRAAIDDPTGRDPTEGGRSRLLDDVIPLSFDDDESLDAIIRRFSSDDHERFGDLIDAALDEWDGEDGWSVATR
jgi:hypothetical protein